MNIQLQKLTLTNFKGIRSKEIEFNNITNIYGDNATGKTTVFDAFLWLLFGKDSTDRKDFEIKTLTIRNKAIEKIDHEVIASLLINGEQTNIRRVYREKWQKQRGKSESEMTGHETEYFWNDVPMQQKEYQAKIAGICDETLFKLLTNTGYFNSLKWEDKRTVLLSIAGELSDSQIAEGDTDFERLLEELGKKTIKEKLAEVSAKKKNLKEQLEEVPIRIQEAKRSMPDEADYTSIENQLRVKQSEMQVVEDGINNESSAANEVNRQITEKINTVHTHKTAIQQLEFNIGSEIAKARQQRESEISKSKALLRTWSNELDANNKELQQAKNRIATLENECKALRENWAIINSETFTPNEFKFDETNCTCPTCNQQLPVDNINKLKESLEANFKRSELTRQTDFYESKATRLNSITTTGKGKAVLIEGLNKRIAEIEKSEVTQANIDDLIKDIANYEQIHTQLNATEAQQIIKAVADNTEIKSLNDLIAGLETEIKALQQPNSKLTDELKEKKISITAEIDALKQQLIGKEARQRQQERIAELERQEKDYAQQLADLEGTEFTIQRFEKARMDTLEQRVNSMFKYVQFKMFDTQINGGEKPTCVALINGVPYSDANNGAKINAGLDIIRVLSNFHNVKAPIFIDNAEGVTKLINVNGQVIRLIVSEPDKKLRIESYSMEAVA